MKKILAYLKTAPVLFFLIGILTYGIFIPRLGFYGDDWSYLFFQHLLGPQGSGVFAAYDRPLSSWYYNLVIGVLGESPLPYHIYLFFLRWISAVLLWKILEKVWPRKKDVAVWISLLFLVYPGFMQHPISVEFILHYFAMDMFLLSILGMLFSLQYKKWFYLLTLGSMACSGVLFSIEYFLGWEALRPFMLWLAIRNQEKDFKKGLIRSFLLWLPYLIIPGVFLIWRVFFFKFPTYAPVLLEHLAENPKSALIQLAKTILVDSKTVLLDAWQQIVLVPPASSRWGYILVVLASLTLVLFFFFRKEKNQSVVEERSGSELFREWPLHLILLGGIGLLTAGWPFWITGISVELGFPWDRPTLSFMLGVSLVLAGVIDLLIRPKYSMWIFAVLVSLSVGVHYLNAQVYIEEWSAIKEFYWQLTWRAPDLEPYTVLASDDIPLYRVGDSAMSGILNWTYAPDHHDAQLLYKLFDLHIRLDSDYAGIPAVEEGLDLEHNYRGTFFTSSTSNLMAYTYSKGQCLKVLYPYDDDYRMPEKVLQILPLSKPELILEDDESPAEPPAFMGPEPEHGWCYFYEKAELANANQEWEKTAEYWELSQTEGLTAITPYDLLTFLEGYIHLEDWEKANQFSQMILQDQNMQPLVCTTIERVKKTMAGTSNHLSGFEKLKREAGCTP